jgi:maleylpyruvate isomerase
MPICEFLEEQVPEPCLIPKDPFLRAEVRAFCEMINAGIQPLSNLKVRQKLDEAGQDSAAWNKLFIEQGFDGIILKY